MDSRGFIFAGSSNGMYRSNDHGRTWQKQALTGTYFIDPVMIDPDIIYAATLSGVHVSTDNGSTWS